jgi:hypothetical protein
MKILTLESSELAHKSRNFAGILYTQNCANNYREIALQVASRPNAKYTIALKRQPITPEFRFISRFSTIADRPRPLQVSCPVTTSSHVLTARYSKTMHKCHILGPFLNRQKCVSIGDSNSYLSQQAFSRFHHQIFEIDGLGGGDNIA